MIIAFTALKQSGKTTLADYICEKHGFVKINFKDALDHELEQNFSGVLKEILKLDGFKELYNSAKDLLAGKPPIIRKFKQEYGTEVRRGDDPEYWVKRWQMVVNKFMLSGETNIVVDDCRMINEALKIKNHDGHIIRIERPSVENTDTHSSETEQKDITPDYVIQNDGTVEQLFDSFESIFNKIKEQTL